MKRTTNHDSYESPRLEYVEIELEGGYALSDNSFGGSNEDLDDFEDMDWGN